MIRLHGFAISNYYNVVKLALLVKEIPFEEVYVKPNQTPETLARSPLGKVPFLETPDGWLSETAVILDYLEARYPAHPLLPADPWAAAKLRELRTHLELHVELVARQLYGQAFFGAPASESAAARVRSVLERHLPAVRKLASFSPYIGGDQFTQVDCVAFAHFPVIAMLSKVVWGDDILAAHGFDWKPYAKLIETLPQAQRVTADRKAESAAAKAG
jgi:glutathione S-transferase